MAFIVEHVKSLLQRDLVTELEKVKMSMNIAKIKQFPVHRDLLAERDIPDGCSGKVIALR